MYNNSFAQALTRRAAVFLKAVAAADVSCCPMTVFPKAVVAAEPSCQQVVAA